MGRERVVSEVATACRKHVWRRAEHSLGVTFMQIWWVAGSALNRTRAAPAGRPAVLDITLGVGHAAHVMAWHRIGATLRSLGARDTVVAQWSVNELE